MELSAFSDQQSAKNFELKRFWPIFKKAEELGTSIFIHVEDPRPSMKKFYNEFSQSDATPIGRDFDVCMEAVQLIESAPLSDSDKEKIYHLNAERIFGIKA